jgi:mannose-6-phosphate isomerase
VELLDNPIREYAWGSRTAIAAAQGRPVPAEHPEAELWMGAHDGAPSRLPGGRSLAEEIEADPAGTLGEQVAAEFGPRLPFLLKLLAADAPLSIQAHPDADQARAGFEAERRAGSTRNYTDPFHKPELICAISPFEALCGFRPVPESLALLDGLDVAALAEPVAALRAGDLRSAVANLLTRPDAAALVDEVAKAGAALDGEPYAVAVSLADRYPGDAGVVLSLLLNLVRLAPGEALFLPAGVPHAYLRGVGVEIMASSDNVLRGGLTPKRVDADELLRVLRFDGGPAEPFEPDRGAPGVLTWRPPVREFALSRVELAGDLVLPGAGPRIVFCYSGAVTADDGTGPVTLTGGQAAFVPAGRRTALHGEGLLFSATTGV